VLKSLVIVPNERTQDMRSLVNIASAEAKRREGTHQDIPIRALKFIPELGVYVAIYDWEHSSSGARGRKGSEK